MKHYVVVLVWASEGENDSNILCVAHSFEEAKKVFDDTIDEERQIAEDNNWVIYENNDTVFEAGEDGHYCENHSKLYIMEVIQNGKS